MLDARGQAAFLNTFSLRWSILLGRGAGWFLHSSLDQSVGKSCPQRAVSSGDAVRTLTVLFISGTGKLVASFSPAGVCIDSRVFCCAGQQVDTAVLVSVVPPVPVLGLAPLTGVGALHLMAEVPRAAPPELILDGSFSRPEAVSSCGGMDGRSQQGQGFDASPKGSRRIQGRGAITRAASCCRRYVRGTGSRCISGGLRDGR